MKNLPLKNVGRKGRLVRMHRQAGVTLVEVLVTAVIISVGLLGVAALHLTSLKNSTESTYRSKATWFANDIIERMRANNSAAQSQAYVIAYGATVSPGTIAQNDLSDWKTRLASAAGLPNGDGQITMTPAGQNFVYTIRIRWSERERDNNDPIEFVTETEI